MMTLDALGWDSRLDEAFAPYRDQDLVPARVAREDRDRYLLLDARGERPAELTGRLRHEARTRSDLPAVGDWVAARPGDALDLIVAVLPRASAFLRQAAGGTTGEQVVAANVDTAFLVAGLDGDLNPRRIERYLAAAWESGANPVIVLNKADVAGDLAGQLAEVEAVALGVPVVAISALAGEGLEALAPWLEPGRTVAMLGSSGVGKSTLLNALLGEERQATAEVREDDARGRHTTTRRELFVLPGGALLLDTPGLRELALWSGEDSLDVAFPDIAALAERCRFRDCAHDQEPGCAVREAAGTGGLDPARLASWHKLQRELRWLARRQDALARTAELSRWKAIIKSLEHHPKVKRRK
jgi:ribosome biogenesis GTPase